MISQRVVGFVVLIAIAVIFWPIVFVVPETEENVELPVLEMPPRPQIVISARREPDLQKVDPSSLPTIPAAPPSAAQPIDIASPSVTESLWPADFKPSKQTRRSKERSSMRKDCLLAGNYRLLRLAHGTERNK